MFDESKVHRDKGRFATGDGLKASIGDRQKVRDDKHAVSIRKVLGARLHDVYQRAIANGGFTFDVGHDVFPRKGFVVSAYPEHELRLKGKVDEKDISDYVSGARLETLAHNPKACIGGWYNDKKDEWVLDISHVEKNRDQAIKVGRQYKQEAIYDLEKGEPIEIGAAQERWKSTA